MNQLIDAKVAQAITLLREFDLPVWIVQFARETYDNPQPVQSLAVGATVTWPAAFVVTAAGERIAIVGTGDVVGVESVGAYRTVTGYVRDIGPPLRQLLERLDPPRIGISTSVGDDSADNLTHGMYQVLGRLLQGTPFATRLVPADDVLVALRSRKLPVEVTRIREAIDGTNALFARIPPLLRPGLTERELARQMHAMIEQAGDGTAWDANVDPIVNFGPGSSFGHAAPGEIELAPGMLVHIDLGIKRNGYCSDLQRMWYLPCDDERGAPERVRHAFDTVVHSIRAGFETLRPGVAGWEVDAAARTVIREAGYPEPEFALGHQLGQTTHDGGALLGPRWPRYLNRPEMRIEEGMVFTLEFGLDSPAGQVGVEEDVLVTADGALYLSEPQSELRLLCHT